VTIRHVIGSAHEYPVVGIGPQALHAEVVCQVRCQGLGWWPESRAVMRS